MEKRVCGECFKPLETGTMVCPYCGHSAVIPEGSSVLIPGTVLNNRYLIGKKLGKGGFGLTYVAYDSQTMRKVAIKEYFPEGAAYRDSQRNGPAVCVSEEAMRYYNLGLEKYVKEVNTMIQLYDLAGIVRVLEFFYANNTAYMVMEFIDGISLEKYLEDNGGRLTLQQTLDFMQPVLSSLAVLHEHHVIHRDISPDNIMISYDGQVQLIDFGAARSCGVESEHSRTVMVKQGYAPMEQYSRNDAQGEYTDVYAVCATIYKMLTGEVPTDAHSRFAGYELKPIRSFKNVKVPAHIERAILKGLSIRGGDRQQSIAELYAQLYATDAQRLEQKVDKVQKIMISTVLIACVLALCIVFFVVQKNTIGKSGSEKESVTTSSSSKFDKTEEDSDEKKEEEGSREETKNEEEETVTQQSQETTAEQPDSSSVLDGMENQNTERIQIVKDSVFTDYNQYYTVEEIFEKYYEKGIWQETTDADGNPIVNYIAEENGDLIAYVFYVYENNTFSLTNIARNGRTIANMNGYFESVMESVGVQ